MAFFSSAFLSACFLVWGSGGGCSIEDNPATVWGILIDGIVGGRSTIFNA